MDAPTVESLTTVAGLAIIINLLMGILKRVWDPDPDILHRYGPLIALVMGIILAVLASILLGLDPAQPALEIAQALLTGLVAAASAIGIYEVGKSATTEERIADQGQPPIAPRVEVK